MAVNPTHGLQRADAENQESETSPNESAKENEHWFTLLEKNRLQAYQHLQRYITAQQGHVQLDDADPLSNYQYSHLLHSITYGILICRSSKPHSRAGGTYTAYDRRRCTNEFASSPEYISPATSRHHGHDFCGASDVLRVSTGNAVIPGIEAY